jgi:hypothetical protein
VIAPRAFLLLDRDMLKAVAAIALVASTANADPITYEPMKPAPAPAAPPEPTSRVPAYIAGGITAGLLVTTLVVWHHGSGDGGDVSGQTVIGDPTATPESRAQQGAIRRWYYEMGALGGVTVLGGVVTTVLWSRSEPIAPSSQLVVAPTAGGAIVAIDGRF